MVGGKTSRAAKRLNVDHFRDFLSINLQGDVNSLQLHDKALTKMFFDFLDLAFDDLFPPLFVAFCLALDALFVPGFLGGGVGLLLLAEDVDDFLAVFLTAFLAVLRVDFRVVFLGGIVA